jgi:hypothetical protein
LKRLSILMICTFFLGGTLVPAGHLPCCCKSKNSSSHGEILKSCCARIKSRASCCSTDSTLRGCCQAKTKSGCSVGVKAVECKCPICPFSKQMEIAADSGFNGNQAAKRLSVFQTASTTLPSFPVRENPAYSGPVKSDHIGITVLSRTCTLLI